MSCIDSISGLALTARGSSGCGRENASSRMSQRGGTIGGVHGPRDEAVELAEMSLCDPLLNRREAVLEIPHGFAGREALDDPRDGVLILGGEQMAAATRRLRGQVSRAPSAVAAQSNAAINCAVSPPPARNLRRMSCGPRSTSSRTSFIQVPCSLRPDYHQMSGRMSAANHWAGQFLAQDPRSPVYIKGEVIFLRC